MHIVRDNDVPFRAYFIQSKSKVEQRQQIAEQALTWIRLQAHRGAKGAIMVDIDDTLIDGNEAVQNGFQFMKMLYGEASLLYPIHIVTARPDSDKDRVMIMLQKRGFFIPPDRLWMLPSQLYGQDYSHVERFKWDAFLQIGRLHGGVVARFGDKLWDVAHIDSLRSYLAHIKDRHCYVFMDPRLKGTLSGKLPGVA